MAQKAQNVDMTEAYVAADDRSTELVASLRFWRHEWQDCPFVGQAANPAL
jgi:hypothetical protein